MKTPWPALARSLKWRLKSSSVRDAYWALAHQARLESLRKEVQFYRALLVGFNPGDLIFDIGANKGDKTDIFLRLGARVLAVEPDEACSRTLKERFQKFRLSRHPVRIDTRAMSDQVATEEMLVDGPASAVNTMSRKWAESLRKSKATFPYEHCGLEFTRTKLVRTTTLDELMDANGAPFFVKIDVEGHELRVLRGLHRSVPYLSFEVNLPEFASEGLECIGLLSKLAPAGRFNFTSDCTRGFALDDWASGDRFSTVLDRCSERSIEVFWRSDCR
jgi:FkbM family methyltransferase